MNLHVFNALIGSKSGKVEQDVEDSVDETFLSLVQLNDCIATIVTCFKNRSRRMDIVTSRF